MKLVQLIGTELSKQKRSFLWLFLFIIPLGTTGAMLLDMVIRYDDYLFPNAQENGISSWEMLINENHGVLSWGLFLPVFVAVISAFIHQNESKVDNWKNLLSLPVTRGSVLLSKYLIILVFGWLLVLFNALGLILVGKLTGFPESVSFELFGRYVLFQFISLLAIAAIQNLLNVIMKNPIFPVVVAFVGMIVSGILMYQHQQIGKFFPFLYPYIAGDLGKFGFNPDIAISGGLIYGAIVFMVGLFVFNKKDIV
ncbi:ABC transporter permease [Pseudalkalibacillus decolorationis]|uniref:ABC transporter permease n=1 Tax=Pseudalkalibacillus decolorationis TaxID=163879 RepID=UPI0021477EB1|nr:ABC transporter permease [Pseudalkalibacillus decolorationis]